MIAYIRHDTPELFDKPFPDGSCFRCSETCVPVYLHTLGPANHEQILSNHISVLTYLFF
jgi:hypothetical protein